MKRQDKTMEKLFATFAILILFTLFVQFTEAADTKKDKPRSCWHGSATGMDIMKTNRTTTKKNCTTEEKTCMKWFLKQAGKKIKEKIIFEIHKCFVRENYNY